MEIGSKFSNHLIDIFLEIMNLIFNRNWKTLLLTLTKAIMLFFPNVHENLNKHLQNIIDWIKSLFEPAPQMENGIMYLAAAAICSLLSMILNININHRAKSFMGYLNEIAKDVTSMRYPSYLAQITRLISMFADSIKEFIFNLFGYKDPRIRALKFLREESEMFKEFVDRAHIFLDEINMTALKLPSNRTNFWFTVIQAKAIQSQIALAPRDKVVTPTLSKICSDVIKKANEISINMKSCPVRYEPFVICIEGEPGIGKSFLTQKIISDCFEYTNHKFPGIEQIYVKNSGAKFWSNYEGNPAVVFDEWLNIKSEQLIVDTLGDFFQLKSTATFTPPMAELNEKKIKANPLIVLINTNEAFPNNIIDQYANKDAIYRRRDLLVKAKLKEEYGKLSSVRGKIETSVLEHYDHLEFEFYLNPVDRKSNTGEYVSFEEFRKELLERWKHHDDIEQQNMKARLKRMYKDLGNMNSDELIQNDPFKIFYAMDINCAEINQNAFLPSEMLEQEVKKFIANIKKDASGNGDHPEVQFDGIGTLSILSKIYKGLELTSVGTEAISSLLDILDVKDGICYKCGFKASSFIACNVNEHHQLCSYCYIKYKGIDSCDKCLGTLKVACNFEDYEGFGKIIAYIRSYGYESFAKLCTVNGYARALIGFPMLLTSMSMIYKQKKSVLDFKRINICAETAKISTLSSFSRCLIGYGHSYTQQKGEVKKVVIKQDDIMFTKEGKYFHIRNDERSALAYLEEHQLNLKECQHELVYQHISLFKLVCDDQLNPRECHLEYEGKVGETGMFTIIQDGKILWIGSDAFCNKTCLLKTDFKTWYNFIRTELINTYKEEYSKVFGHDADEYAETVRYKSCPPYLIPEIYMQKKLLAKDQKKIEKFNFWEYVKERLGKIGKILAYLSGIAAVVAILVKVFKGNKPDDDDPGIVGDQGSNVYEYTRPKNAPRATVKYVMPKPRIQMGYSQQLNPTAFESTKNKILQNMVEITLRSTTTDARRRLYGLGIVSHFLLIPKHYYQVMSDAYDETIEFRFVKDHKIYPYNYSASDFIVVENMDVALVKTPSAMDMFKDIRKYFITNERMNKAFPAEAFLYLVPSGSRSNPMIQNVNLSKIHGSKEVYDYKMQDLITHADVIEYNYSETGACGSPLLIDEQRSIVGFHTAGVGVLTAGIGYSCIITSELLDELLPKDKNIYLERLNLEEELPVSQANYHPEEQGIDVEPLYAVDPSLRPYVPGATKIKPSLIQVRCPNMWQPKEFPAILSKRDKRYQTILEQYGDISPLYAGLESHGKVTVDFPTHFVELAKKFIWINYFKYEKAKVNDPRKLTIEEAIVGFPEIEGYDCMDLTTSVGWPWTTTGQTQKNKFVTYKRNEQEQPIGIEYIDEALKYRIYQNSEARKKGLVPPVVFVDTLKDERRKPEKIAKFGGTRVFCASPIDYSIECRQTFLHFMAMFRRSRLKQPHGIGINPDGFEWGMLANRLLDMNPLGIFTFDYTNFGASINSKVLRAACDIMIKWTLENVEGVDELEMYSLVENVINSDHIVNNLVYRQKCGAPSGSVFTDVLNSLVNMLYVTIAWRMIMGTSYEFMLEKFTYVVYGDDIVASIHKDYVDKFNAKILSDFFKEYGIVGTDATKSDEVVPYGTIYEATFLQRSFKIHPLSKREYLAPINFNTVEDCLLWIWKCANEKEATRENARASLMLCYGHGPEVFANHLEKVNKALKLCEIQPLPIQWEELDANFYPQFYT